MENYPLTLSPNTLLICSTVNNQTDKERNMPDYDLQCFPFMTSFGSISVSYITTLLKLCSNFSGVRIFQILQQINEYFSKSGLTG